MALDDVVNEIKGRQKMAPVQAEKPSPKKEGVRKKPITKAEIEAYRQRKMAEEEAKYLKMAEKAQGSKTVKQPKPSKPQKPAKPAKADKPADPKPKQPSKPKQPRPLQPMEVLYLLKIPGLPKGDCIAICLAHGAE